MQLLGKAEGDVYLSELGVFAVDRGVWDHPVLRSEHPLSKREAWLWLLSAATWKEKAVEVEGKVVNLRRGQLAHSLRFIAKQWKWPKSKVERFLTRLETETMIGTHTGTGRTIITINKYNDYQKVALPKRDKNETPAGTEAGHDRDKYKTKEYKEVKEEEKSGADAPPPRDIRSDLFSRGRETLERITGRTPDSCRAIIGRWLKSVDDEAIQVLGAIEDAERNRIADPVAWITQSLKSRGGFRATQANAEPRGLSAVAREYAERAAELARGGSLRDGNGSPTIRVISGGKSE